MNSIDLKALQNKDSVKILALETSCDETAAAIVENGTKVLANKVFSQIDIHSIYGGVVPEIASRAHMEMCNRIIDSALEEAGLQFGELDALAVTYGPGLVGALLTGVSCMKGLSYATKLPLIPVNHILGHVFANYISNNVPETPFICLIASGGHSHIILVKNSNEYDIIGRTVDDAAGEAFDKAARVLGLKYPGGPLLSKLAEKGNPKALKLPTPKVQGKYDFSFSGLKTAFVNACHNANQKGEIFSSEDYAASFVDKVTDMLSETTLKVAKDLGVKNICLAGGVSANKQLREKMTILCNTNNIKLFMPKLEYCTDNAAMIASVAYFALQRGEIANFELNAVPGLSL